MPMRPVTVRAPATTMVRARTPLAAAGASGWVGSNSSSMSGIVFLIERGGRPLEAVAARLHPAPATRGRHGQQQREEQENSLHCQHEGSIRAFGVAGKHFWERL